MPSITVNGSMNPDDHEALTSITASTGLTSTKYNKTVSTNAAADVGNAMIRRAREALITVEVDDIKWTVDGTTPQTTAGGGAGHHAVAGDNITLQGYQAISRFRAINETAANGAILRVTYFF